MNGKKKKITTEKVAIYYSVTKVEYRNRKKDCVKEAEFENQSSHIPTIR